MYWCTDVLHQVHSSRRCEVFDVLKVPDFIQRRSGIISLIFKEREYCQSNDIISETSLYCVSVQQELSFSYWDNTNSPFASRGCELSFQRWQELGWPCCPQQPPAQPCWGPPWASQRCRARASSLPQSAARQHTTALGDSPNTSRLILTLNLKKNTSWEPQKRVLCNTISNSKNTEAAILAKEGQLWSADVGGNTTCRVFDSLKLAPATGVSYFSR